MTDIKTKEYKGVVYELGKVYAFKEYASDDGLVYDVLEDIQKDCKCPFRGDWGTYALCFQIENAGTITKLPDPIIKEAATVLSCDTGINTEFYIEHCKILYDAGLLNKKEDK